MLEGREIVMYGDGAQTRDFTYVHDIVDGLVLAPVAPAGTVMNLGGGNRVSLARAIESLGEIMGIEPLIAQRPAEAGDVRDTWADVSLAQHAVCYEPSRQLSTGLAAEVAWVAATR